MNLNQLRYFISVAETLNFTKAADQCYISQTAMTQQIRALEKIVGVPLLIRDKHHVELTAAGRVYLKEARVILERNNDALRLARLVSEGTKGQVTIGYTRGLGQSDFNMPLRMFHQTFPHVKLKLISENTSILFEKLNHGECDIIFTVSPLWREYPAMKHRYLKSYPVVVVLPADHPFADYSTLTYQDLRNEQFIMMEPSNRPKDQMEESIFIYKNGGYYPNIIEMEGNPETLLLMISIGMGISILPEYVARPYKNDKNLKLIPIINSDGGTDTVDLEVDWLEQNTNPVLPHVLESLEL